MFVASVNEITNSRRLSFTSHISMNHEQTQQNHPESEQQPHPESEQQGHEQS